MHPVMSDQPESLTLREIAQIVGGTVEGDAETTIRGVASIRAAGPDEMTFAADERRAGELDQSRAGAALVALDAPGGAMPRVRVEDVPAALSRLLERLAGPEDLPSRGVAPSAVVAEDAEVSPDAAIGPGAVVGPRARIGAGSVLCASVVVGADARIGRDAVLQEGVVVKARCRIGDRVRIGPNSVIGSEGFGYDTRRGVHHRVPHAGSVVIENDVDLGASVCVDRAKFGCTRIGRGSKIDNLVQIAHNVQVGEGCLIAAMTGIAGSAVLGPHVVLGGHVGVRDNVEIGEGVQCAAYAAIASDIPPGQIVMGIPAGPAAAKGRALVAADKLPEIIRRVRRIEKRLASLESSEDH